MHRFGFLIAVLICVPAFPQTEGVVVGVADFPPNVLVEQSGAEPTFAGFDIDLWQAVAARAGIEYEIRQFTFQQLLAALREGEVDVGLAGITINSERVRDMDFSHPYMRSGLRILTRPRQESSWVALLRAVANSAATQALLYLLGFIALAANVLYFVERGRGAIDESYLRGVCESAWCILATMTTVGYGDIAPKTWFGRFVAALVMLTGIGLFGLIVADLSAGLTLQQLNTEIKSAADLRGRPVATVEDSTSVDVLEDYGASIRTTAEIAEAFRLLEQETVDAVVFDGPPLQQYVADHQDSGAVLVDGLIEPQQYGIALLSGSELRTPVNAALLELEESGEIARLYEEWFGAEPE